MDASWHFEVVYFSSFQVPHSKKIFIKRSYPVISSTEFVLLELVLPQGTNSRSALPSALHHKQTRMQRLTVICFPFDNRCRHFNAQCREHHPDSWPLLANNPEVVGPKSTPHRIKDEADPPSGLYALREGRPEDIMSPEPEPQHV